LTWQRVEEVRAALDSVIRTKRSITLDLRGLEFIDSTRLHLVVEIDAMARRDGFNLTVVKAPEPVQRTFRIAGVEDDLVLVDAPEDLSPPN